MGCLSLGCGRRRLVCKGFLRVWIGLEDKLLWLYGFGAQCFERYPPLVAGADELGKVALQ